MRLYGSLNNRVDEGHNFLGRPLRAGDDITMYLWSDRRCFYVSEVIDERHIKVLPYYVCADQSKAGGMGHQNWLYFKSVNEQNRYLNGFIGEGNSKYRTDFPEPEPDEWVFRQGKWRLLLRFDKAKLERAIRLAQEASYTVPPPDALARIYFDGHKLTDREYQRVLDGKEVRKTHRLSGNVSFGVRDYYYDWEF